MRQLAGGLRGGLALCLCHSVMPAIAIERVTVMVAERQPGAEFLEIARADRLTAEHTEGSPAQRPAIHQNEPHIAALNARKYDVTSNRRPIQPARN